MPQYISQSTGSDIYIAHIEEIEWLLLATLSLSICGSINSHIELIILRCGTIILRKLLFVNITRHSVV